MDMNPPGEADPDWAGRMIGGKTAAMIRVSLELGALAGGCATEAFDAVSAAGDRLGLLFQLTDDLLDVSGDPEEMGKAVRKDAGRGKANLVTMYGLERSRGIADRLVEELDAGFAGLPGRWEMVRLLVAYLPRRRS